MPKWFTETIMYLKTRRKAVVAAIILACIGFWVGTSWVDKRFGFVVLLGVFLLSVSVCFRFVREWLRAPLTTWPHAVVTVTALAGIAFGVGTLRVDSRIGFEMCLATVLLFATIYFIGRLRYRWEYIRNKRDAILRARSIAKGGIQQFLELVDRFTLSELDQFQADSDAYDLDKEYTSAARRHRLFMAAHPRNEQKLEDRTCFLAGVPYSNISAVADMQKQLEASLKATNVEVTSFPSTSYFDIVNRPEIALANETLCTFPFFLSWQRRQVWGVIPYARHTHLGLCLHSDHAACNNMNAEHLEGDSDGKWINDLVPMLDGDLFVVLGYLHQEILPLLALRWGTPATRRKLVSVLRPLNAETREGNTGVTTSASETVQLGPTLAAAQAPPLAPVQVRVLVENLASKEAHQDAAVFDLADRGALKDEFQRRGLNYKIFSLPHGLFIPVGIGFSLLLWPHIRDIWDSWAKLAYDKLASSKRQLKEIGIDLVDTPVVVRVELKIRMEGG